MSSSDMLGCIGIVSSLIIGNALMDVIYWQSLPRTPYYLKKRILHLEYQLIKQTCLVNEEIIRP